MGCDLRSGVCWSLGKVIRAHCSLCQGREGALLERLSEEAEDKIDCPVAGGKGALRGRRRASLLAAFCGYLEGE